jgi:hypothetical protein
MLRCEPCGMLLCILWRNIACGLKYKTHAGKEVGVFIAGLHMLLVMSVYVGTLP